MISKDCEDFRLKCEQEISILRSERGALEEVISSLQKECETLKMSLVKEFEASDNLRNQLAKLSKESKETDGVKKTTNFCFLSHFRR